LAALAQIAFGNVDGDHFVEALGEMNGDAADAAAEIEAHALWRRRVVSRAEKIDEPGARYAALVKEVERLLREIGGAELVMRQHRPEGIALAKRPPLRLH